MLNFLLTCLSGCGPDIESFVVPTALCLITASSLASFCHLFVSHVMYSYIFEKTLYVENKNLY